MDIWEKKRVYLVGRRGLSRKISLSENDRIEQLIKYKVMRGKWRKEVSEMVKGKQVKGEDYGLNCVASLPVQTHMLQS